MKSKTLLLFALVFAVAGSTGLRAAETDGSDLERELRQRDEKISKLSVEEQLKLRAAHVKAAEDPAVQAALAKRNEAVRELRETLRATVIKVDPAVAPILDKIAVGAQPGF